MAFDRNFCSTNTVKCGPIGRNIWYYDTEDAAAVVTAANYFVDAVEIGMEVGDEVHVRQWTNLPNSSRSPEYRKGAGGVNNPERPADILKSDAAPVAAFMVFINAVNFATGNLSSGAANVRTI